MSFRIDSKHRLVFGNRLVERIMSPVAHTNGTFARVPSTTVMHFTYGASARSSANWFRHPENTKKSSAHVVIGRDGAVIQCVDFDTGANHAGASSWRGTSGLNTWSFGVELANWGYLQNRGGRWTSYTGTAVSDPVLAVHKNGNPPQYTNVPIGWEPYPEAQIKSAVGVVQTLIENYGSQEIIGHDDISAGRKWDPGPAFDMIDFRARVSEDMSDNGPNHMKTYTPGDTLNLRQGPGMNYAVIDELKDGTIVEELEYSGNWVFVGVVGASGHHVKNGWVYNRHLVPV